MTFVESRVLRPLALVALISLVSASSAQQATPARGMTFRMRMTLTLPPTGTRPARSRTLIGRGQFAGGLGRLDIDSVDTPGPFRAGDVILVRDSLNTFWVRPAERRVRRLSAPFVNPLEGISERVTSGTGSPSSLKAVFDTISLDETVNGVRTRHYRITADVVYPVGNRQVSQKVVIDQWLSRDPLRIMNPFSSRIRGLPDEPMVNAAYREFVRTLAAANKVYGDAATIRSQTTTSYVYGQGMGEDYLQTVDVLDLAQAEIDDAQFQLGPEYTRRPPPRRRE